MARVERAHTGMAGSIVMAANICAELTDRLWCPLIPAGNAASLLTGVLAGL